MFDVKQILNQYLGGQIDGAPQGSEKAGNMGGIAGGALAGGLLGLLAGTKTGRKVGKNVLTYGGTALLGGLAYKAWRDWQNGKPAAQPGSAAGMADIDLPTPPSGSAFLPPPGQEAGLERDLIRAMIGAAKADGEIDALERERIFEQAEQLGMDDAMRTFISEELASPLDLGKIVAPAVGAETAAEIYTASLMAVDASKPAEKGYLAMLAARLKLEPGLVEHLHAVTAAAIKAAS